MRTNHIYFIILLFLFSLNSCQKVVDIDLPDQAPKLVLNCNLETGDVFYMEVSTSISALSQTGPLQIEDAEIEILKNGTPLDTTYHIMDGYYVNLDTVEEEAVYMITVSHPDYETISSTTIPPQSVPFTSEKQPTFTESAVPFSLEKIFRVEAEINISDPSEQNFYLLELRMPIFSMEIYGNDTVYLPTGENWKGWLNSELDASYTSHQSGSVLISDELFNGQTKKFKLEADYYLYETEGFVPPPYLLITLKTVNQDFFLYQHSLTRQQETNFDPFAEPVLIYNNIQNGFGILSGISTFQDTIHFQ